MKKQYFLKLLVMALCITANGYAYANNPTVENQGSKMQTNANGGKLIQRPNGTTILIKPDGTKIIKKKNGSQVQIFPDGSKYIKKADGTVIQKNNDRSIIIRKPDGTIIDISANGQKTVTNSNGYVMRKSESK